MGCTMLKKKFCRALVLILSAALVFLAPRLHAQISAANEPLNASTQQTAPALSLDSLKFLLGNWVGEGTTGSAPGTGYCSFDMGLQSKVIVRKNHAEYPATSGHSAIMHDDLMVIYPDAARHQIRAFYTDNEGHIINYTVTAASDGRSAVFLGDTEAGAARYRLTYAAAKPEHASLTFEIAPPDHPDEFQTYIHASLRRTAEAK